MVIGDILLSDGVAVGLIVLVVGDCLLVIFDLVVVAIGDMLLADGAAVVPIVLVVSKCSCVIIDDVVAAVCLSDMLLTDG